MAETTAGRVPLAEPGDEWTLTPTTAEAGTRLRQASRALVRPVRATTPLSTMDATVSAWTLSARVAAGLWTITTRDWDVSAEDSRPGSAKVTSADRGQNEWQSKRSVSMTRGMTQRWAGGRWSAPDAKP